MDRLLEIERTSNDLSELSLNCKEIQRLVDKEALIIPDYYLDFARVGMWKWVRFPSHGNLKYTDSMDLLNPFWGYFWIDEDIKKEVEEAMASNRTFEPRTWRLSKRYAQD